MERDDARSQPKGITIYKEEIVVDIQKTHQKENNSRERETIKLYLLLPRSLGGTIQIMSDK